MQLHQLLRILNFATPVVLFDIAGIEICSVASKDAINIDLYEYPVLEISTGYSSKSILKEAASCLYITIQK